jgi:hypothetical protein
MAAGLLRARRQGLVPAERANGHEHRVRGEGVLDGLWQRRERASGAAALASAPSTTAALASALAVAPTALAVAPAALAGTLAPALATWSESRDP